MNALNHRDTKLSTPLIKGIAINASNHRDNKLSKKLIAQLLNSTSRPVLKIQQIKITKQHQQWPAATEQLNVSQRHMFMPQAQNNQTRLSPSKCEFIKLAPEIFLGCEQQVQ